MRHVWIPLLVVGVGVGASLSCDDEGDGGAGGATTGTAGTAGSGGTSCDGGANPGTGAWAPECGDCHGESADPAPPPDTLGNTATTEPRVGAHRTHQGTSVWHRQIGCIECHPVPNSSPDPCVTTHENSSTDIVWGPVAQQGNYDATTNVCSNVYCHGATLEPDGTSGTTIRNPDWTLTDGTQAGCGISCHTHPPGGIHYDRTDCETCHFEVITAYNAADPPNSTWADASKHIDGIHQFVDMGGAGGTGGQGGAGGAGGN